MATIGEMLRRVEGLKLREATLSIVSGQPSELINLNTAQLELGQYFDGEPIQPDLRNDVYAGYKKGKGGKAPFGIPDLKDSGDFYSGFQMVIEGTEYSFKSSDWKNAHLTEKYSPKIFGLSEESKSKFAQETLFQQLKTYITNITGLQF